MNSKKLILRSILVSSILLCASAEPCSAFEVRRGIVRQTRFPTCPNLCDVYNLQPDSGYGFIYLYSSPGSIINLTQYLDLHVEVTGYRAGCSGCTDLNITQISLLATTEVRNNGRSIPTRLLLSQNYPNPFNPITTFGFQIPARPAGAAEISGGEGSASRASLVTLRVFDILGLEVATLVNEQKAPGTYTVSWDARERPAGVYFCRLQAGKLSETRKMIVLP